MDTYNSKGCNASWASVEVHKGLVKGFKRQRKAYLVRELRSAVSLLPPPSPTVDTPCQASYNTRRCNEMTTYAIVQTGGKQYRVKAGDFIDVEKLPVEVGATVELPHVLLLSQEDQFLVGRPHVEGARVVAEVREQAKDTKIVVFKYKAKTRYRKKQGHRQRFTRLQIMELVAP